MGSAVGSHTPSIAAHPRLRVDDECAQESGVYVTGIGRTKFGVLPQGVPELLYEAVSNALEDAGIDYTELDAAYVANFCGGPFVGQLHLNSLLCSLLPGVHIPIVRIETACASSGAAFFQAGIALSRYRTILVAGVEKMTGLDGLATSYNIAMAGDAVLEGGQGLIFPATYALMALAHMERYGTTLDDLALVSLKNHENANRNPLAHFYHKRVTLDEIKSSAVVCTPLRLFDCSPVGDGAAAVVLSAERRSDRDVKVLASTLATDTIAIPEREDLTTVPATRVAASQAYQQAGLRPSDIGVVQVHDCFTIAELVALEDLGFCRAGQAKDLVREGRTSLSGDIPTNVDGGLKADGHPIGASGLGQIYEVVLQLRGDAGERQLENVEVALTHNIGGVGGTCAVHILSRG